MQLRPEQIDVLLGSPGINDEFSRKVKELDRRLQLNGMTYREWETLNDRQHEVFTDNLFLDGECATNVDSYVKGAVNSCGCPDTEEELHHHSPVLMREIEKQQEMLPDMKVKIGEGLDNLNETIDLLLENIIAEEPEVVEEARLDFPMFARQPSRLSVLINKIENNEPFQLEGDTTKTILLKNDPELLSRLKQLQAMVGFSIKDVQKVLGSYYNRLPTAEGGSISLRGLHKTAEFGGKSSDSGTEKEDFAVGELRKLIDAALIDNNNNPITIRLVTQEKGELLEAFEGIVGVRSMGKVKGVDPKTDFVLYAADSDKIYISHKDGTSPKSFGQWGGVTKKAGEDIYAHPEVIDFIKALQAKLPVVSRDEDGNPTRWDYPRGQSYGRIITDDRLKKLAMFGNEYDATGPGGVENADVVAQGPFGIQTTDTPGVYNLTAYHLLVRKDLDGDFDAAYAPTLVTRFSSGRANYRINNMRAGMYPRDNRKIHEWI